MKLNFRAPCEIRPLSSSVEGLIRSLPSVAPPEGMRTRLLAAYERRQPTESGFPVSAWLRRHALGLASGSLAAVAVFGVGTALGIGGAPRSSLSAAGSSWVSVHDMPPASLPRIRVVDDPGLSLGAASSALASLDPQDGP